MQPTSLVLTFSSALDRGAGRGCAQLSDRVNGRARETRSGGHVTLVRAAVYDPATLTVTLIPAERLSVHKLYRLTINGTTSRGLTGLSGIPLDSQGNGMPGTNYVRVLSGKLLAGPAPGLANAAGKKLAAQFQRR